MAADTTVFDAHAQEAIDRARKIAQEARLGHIGTEHILLGLLETPGCAAARALAGLGITVAGVEAELLEQAMRTQRIILSDTMASSLAESVLTSARSRSRAAGRDAVSTSDLLVSLVHERDGVAARVLAELGVGFEEVARALTAPGA